MTGFFILFFFSDGERKLKNRLGAHLLEMHNPFWCKGSGARAHLDALMVSVPSLTDILLSQANLLHAFLCLAALPSALCLQISMGSLFLIILRKAPLHSLKVLSHNVFSVHFSCHTCAL